MMRVVVFLGAVLLSLVLGARAAPTDDGNAAVPCEVAEGTGKPAVKATPDQYRKETLNTTSKNSTQDHVESHTKSNEKVKVKHRKDGSTVTIIKDTTKTKTKKDSVSDQFSQTNHTLTEGGVEDSSSLTQDKQHEVKEVDVVKKKDTERIVRDKNGNIISDTKKSHVKEKDRKKEKNKETKTLVHKVKHVDPPAAADDACVATDAPTPRPEATDAPRPRPETTDAPTPRPQATDAPGTRPEATDAPGTRPEATDARPVAAASDC